MLHLFDVQLAESGLSERRPEAIRVGEGEGAGGPGLEARRRNVLAKDHKGDREVGIGLRPADDEDGEDIPATLGLENLPAQMGAEGDAGALTLGTGSSTNRNRWILLGVLAGLGSLLIIGAGWGRYLWVRGLAGVPEVARRWEQTIRLASWSGNGPDPAQTPHEFAAGLQEHVAGLDGVEVLADRYVDQQFSQESAAAQEDPGFADTWQRVRNRLLRKLLRLK